MVTQKLFLATTFSLLICICSGELDVCKQSLKDMTSGKYNNTLQMLYNSGRDINDLGLYESCNNLDNARYNLMITHYSPVNLVLGLCAPIACETDDLQALARSLIDVYLIDKVPIDPDQTVFYQSESYNRRPIAGKTMLFILFMVLLLGAVAVGTYLDLLANKFPDSNLREKHNLLVCFSIVQNFEKLISMPQQSENTHVFNGIKVFCMLLISFSHSYVYQIGSPLVNPMKVLEYLKSGSHRLAYSSIYVVDIFFVISGFLLAFLTIAELNKRRGRLNWCAFIIHRLMRIIPVYYFAFLLYFCVFPYIGFGPAWPLEEYRTQGPCGDYWYANLLFINNFLPADEPSCMGWSWFIANDMQLYLLSPLILFAHYRSKLIGYASCGGLILTNIIVSAVVASVNDFQPGATYGLSNSIEFSHFYVRPYIRMGAFMIGILVGFLYRGYCDHQAKAENNKSQDIELGDINAESPLIPQPKRSRVRNIEAIAFRWTEEPKFRAISYVLGWLLMIWVVFAPLNFESHGPGYWSKFSTVIFLATDHNIFAIGFCLFFIPMICGHGGSIKDMLSSKHVTVISRISFAYYLMHPLVIIYIVMNTNQAIYITDSSIIFYWFGTVVISAILATLVTLLLESPVINLEKRMFRKRS